ncbi:DUF1616 domain-containing protein [Halorientalis halophila]|uniref:DUF1616 domain-containing protein n=1 Tax=Halorientalis halophila TaxID=3108499 RepID=UPI00300B1745
MSTQSPSRWGAAGRVVRAVPFDLVLVLVLVLFVGPNWGGTDGGSLLGFLLGGAFLFFAPGYVLVAALFPGSARGTGSGRTAFTLTFPERVAVSFGASLTLLPLLALVVAVVGPLSTGRVVGVVAGFAVLTALVATVRRLRLPAERRYSVPTGQWLSRGRAFLTGGSALTTAINLCLAISVLAGLGMGAYAFATPQPGPEYSELALVTDNGSAGYVSGDYPTNLTRGQPAQLTVSVENQYREPVEYTVVSELQQVQTFDERIRVVSETEQHRFSRTIEPGQTWYQPHRIRPQQAGTDQRLVYYLYRGDAPADANGSSADRTVQLWVNVSTGV